MAETAEAADALLENSAANVHATYKRLLAEVRTFGPFREELKKTSIHLAHTVGFAGVHPRKHYLYLNLRTDSPIVSPRIHKSEQVSKNRYHNEIELSTPEEIDAELLTWLRAAYTLG